MKKSVNFNGFKAKHRRITGEHLIATMRALGMSDEEIKAELLRMKAEREAAAVAKLEGTEP